MENKGFFEKRLYKGSFCGFAVLLMAAMVLAGLGSCSKNKTYKLFDTGPGGGLVFYDKGDYSDGWRYLEAAPAKTEFKAN